MNKKLQTFIFHKITNEPSHWIDIKTSQLVSFLNILKKNNTKITNLKDWRISKSNAVALTFDDGFISHYETVMPLLSDKNLSAVFFIITNRIGKKGYMSWSHIKEMSNLGFEIGSHCVTHPRLDRINHDDAYEELVRSKHIIENQIQKSVISFAHPAGNFTKYTNRLALVAGYKNICNSRPGFAYNQDSFIPRTSLTTNHTENGFEKLLMMNKFREIKLITNYELRSFVKGFFGENNYLKFRKFIQDNLSQLIKD